MKCWAASDENIFSLLLNPATEYWRTYPGRTAVSTLLVFSNHTKSLYLFCSLGGWPENFQFCCRHFCQTADSDKTDLQKKAGLLFSPLTFAVFFLIKNCAIYLYLSETHKHTPRCAVSWKFADLYAKIVQD